MTYTYEYESPLGLIEATYDDRAITGLKFNDRSEPGQVLQMKEGPSDSPIRKELIRWLDLYFSGRDPGFTPPLAYGSTPFRKRVCDIMLTIPYGSTVTYGEIARQLAEERGCAIMSSQAVGGAVSHNPIALIIPCHRVIGARGKLTGYGGGLDRKRKLLESEGALGRWKPAGTKA